MNKLKKLDILFEVKSMGISFFVPVLSVLFLIFLSYTELGPEITRKLSLFIEFIICPLAAWWCIYLFIDYYEENMEEVLFTYPVSFFFHGVLRSIIFLILYILLLILGMIPISLRHELVQFSTQVFQYIPQCILYGAVGFCLTVMTRTIVFPILCIVGYAAGKYFTGGSNLFPIYNIMFFDIESSRHLIVEKAITNIGLALLFFFIGHIILRKRTLINK